MRVNGKHYRTIWMEKGVVFMIEQNLLPFEFKIVKCKYYTQTCLAIKTMVVRGAGAIGVAAGYAMAQAFIEAGKLNYVEFAEKARKEIESTRPTARNLFYATKRVFDAGLLCYDKAIEEAEAIAEEDIESSKKIGEFGNQLLGDGCKILTHCNAGWLAFTNYGTALSPVYEAVRTGKKVFVYIDETRPRSQGARLTAWELKNENIPHVIIPDNAAAHLMAQQKVDIVITGADRIAANGDTANKIGTLEKAILAHEFGIPFYIAAPLSTFDLNCHNGSNIPIEERDQSEVLYQTGIDKEGNPQQILVCNPGSAAWNPAFDVTPAKYLTGIITEKGIIKPNSSEILSLF